MIKKYYDENDLTSDDEYDPIGEDRELIGYCSYCKDEIFLSEDFVKKQSKIYHTSCWEEKHNFVEELNF